MATVSEVAILGASAKIRRFSKYFGSEGGFVYFTVHAIERTPTCAGEYSSLKDTLALSQHDDFEQGEHRASD